MSKNFSPNAFNQQSFGAAGFKLISSASGTVTGDFVAITVIVAVEVDADKIVTTTGDDLPSGTLLPKGVTIYGDFTSIDLKSGKVIAYHRALG